MSAPDRYLFYEAVGDAIRGHRVRNQVTQARLAELVGVKQSAISRIEAGSIRIRHGRLSRIAAVLGVPVVELYEVGGRAMADDVDQVEELGADDVDQVDEAETVARMFHDTYERLAPEHGYRTRKASAVPWDQVPQANRELMIATSREVLAFLVEGFAPRPPVPMHDSHDDVTKPAHYGTFEGTDGVLIAVAISTRNELAPWFASTDPVLSVNEIGSSARPGVPRITRTSLYTLTGEQCAALFDKGVAGPVRLL